MKTELGKLLNRLGACNDAVNWVGERDLATAWAECERADWMLWLCGRMIGKDGWPTHQQIVLVVCLCAETALPIFEKKYPKNDRPRKVIEAARAWANGTGTKAQARAAVAAAADAAYAAYAAAVAAAADAAYAAYAAAYAAAAYDAADAADAAYAAAAAAAATRAGALRNMASIVRENLKIPVEESQ